MKKVFSALLLGLAFVACQPAEYDDTAIKEQIGSLDDRLSKVEEDLATLELNVDAMKTLADALKNGKYIESYEALEDGSGYTIRFSDGTTIVVKHGAKGDKGDTGETGATGATGAAGADGKDGVTPTVTVKEVDGEYYWFINGEQICPVYEETPEFTSKDGVLYVTYPGETEPVAIGALTGVSIFHSVEVKDDVVVFTFVDENGLPGESFTLPLAAEFALEINTSVGLAKDQTEVEIPYTVTGATDATVVDVIAVGCTAAVDAEASVVKVSGITEGAQILVFADNGEGKTSIRKVTFSAEAYSVEPVDEIIPAEGGQVIVKGISNVAFDVVIPAEATWLTQVVSKSSFELTFAAEANTATEARSAEVSFVRQGTEEVLMTVTIAQAGAEEQKEFATLLWKLSSGADSDPWWTGLLTDGVANMDRTATTDGEYVYIAKAGAGVTGIYAIEIANPKNYKMVNMTGVEGGYFPTSCVRVIKNPTTGKYILIASAMGMNAYESVNIYAWENGIDEAPTVMCGSWTIPDWASRRFGDFFTVCGDWTKGELWFRSMTSCTVARYSIVDGVLQNPGSPDGFGNLATDVVAMGSVYRYSLSAANVLVVTPDVAKFVDVNSGTDIAWNTTDVTFNKCYGFTPFTANGKNYIAYTRMETAAKGSLVIIEDEAGTADGFQAALEANKVVYESKLHNTEITLSCWSGNTMANCCVCEKDGETYIVAHQQNVGVSVFKLN